MLLALETCIPHCFSANESTATDPVFQGFRGSMCVYTAQTVCISSGLSDLVGAMWDVPGLLTYLSALLTSIAVHF